MLIYLFVVPIIYILSIYPLNVLLGAANGLHYFILQPFGYRKQVILTNLKNSFPDKPEKEIKEIAKKYYHNLADLIFENIKLLTIGKKAIKERCVFENPELVNSFFDEGKSVIMTLGHMGNWEMAGLGTFQLKPKPVSIYRRLSNHRFDRLFKKMRSRFGAELVPQHDTRALLSKLKEPGFLYNFITDQAPQSAETSYWTIFLNQDTPVSLGAERIAKRTNLPVVFAKVSRKQRGHYRIRFQLVTDNPSSCQPYEITERHTRLLERAIREEPDNWLWSHRRWKRSKPQHPKHTLTQEERKKFAIFAPVHESST